MTMVATRPVRSTSDVMMRRLLRIEGEPDAVQADAARSAMSKSILVSAVRCMVTYVLIPFGVPVLHVLDAIGRPLSIALCLVAIFFSTRSVRRFWAADHRYRWPYTFVAAIVVAYMVFGITTDLLHIL
jgi:hypothetical protein